MIRVELTMIRTPHHTNPLVLLQPVDFVQEVASRARCHETVDVFEDQEARRGFTRFLEDAADAVFRVVGCEGFDAEAGYGVGEVAEGSHHGFDGECFAVAGGAVEDDAALERG